MTDSKQSTRGWNWGTYNFEKANFTLSVDGKTAFEIPYSDISNSSISNKNEMALEFHQDDTSKDSGNYDMLCEMRFYVPNTTGQETDPAETMHQEIVKRANIGAFAGEAIASFSELPMVLPRGKYTLDTYQTFLKFHGRTHDYKILYRNISKAYLLPKPDGLHMYYVLALETAIRQGQTLYPFIILQFPKDEEVKVSINLSPEQIKEQYNDQLEPELEGKIYDVMSRLFKSLLSISIIVPGTFTSSRGSKGVRCSVKACEGYLYPLNKTLLFIPKPVISVKIEDILYVEFGRVNDSSAGTIRSFDLTVALRSGGNQQFTGIDKQEYKNIVEYLQEKKIVIKNVQSESAKVSSLMKNIDLGSDEEEEEKLPKRSAARRTAKEDIEMLPDDYDEEEDEDYVGGASDADEPEDDEDEEDEADLEPEDVPKKKSNKSTEKKKK